MATVTASRPAPTRTRKPAPPRAQFALCPVTTFIELRGQLVYLNEPMHDALSRLLAGQRLTARAIAPLSEYPELRDELAERSKGGRWVIAGWIRDLAAGKVS